MKRRALLAAIVASALASPFPAKNAKAAKPKQAQKVEATTTERGVGVGVTERIAPTGLPPAGCQVDYNGVFAIAVVNITRRAAIYSNSSSLEESPALLLPSPASEAASNRSLSASPSPADPQPASPIEPAFIAASTAPAAPLASPASESMPGMEMGGASSTSDTAGSGSGSESGSGSGSGSGLGSGSSSSSNAAGSEIGTGAGAGAGAAVGAGIESGASSTDETDSTTTLRSTRTQTRTVTIRRTVVGQRPTPGTDSGTKGKGAVKAYMISQIADGQIQAPVKPTSLSMTTLASIGVPGPKPTLATTTPTTATTTGAAAETPKATKPVSTVVAISEIGDGQIQAPVAAGTPKPALAVASAPPAPPAAPPAPPAPPAAPPAPAASMAPMAGMGGMEGMNMHHRRQSPGAATQLVACKTPSTLQVTLKDGILKDAKARTGYIASNFQFQFDGPPQSGSIYTAGFSVCGNGQLALGGTTTWYQCRSGDFYNLYDRDWAPQCNPITINAVMLKDC